MKAKQLIRILQGLAPDTNVIFELGRGAEYRKLCAKAELAIGSCLDILQADKVEVLVDDGEDGELCNIILSQSNIPNLDDVVERYDEQIKKAQSWQR
jgi:hypothetical protein